MRRLVLCRRRIDEQANLQKVCECRSSFIRLTDATKEAENCGESTPIVNSRRRHGREVEEISASSACHLGCEHVTRQIFGGPVHSSAHVALCVPAGATLL